MLLIPFLEGVRDWPRWAGCLYSGGHMQKLHVEGIKGVAFWKMGVLFWRGMCDEHGMGL